MSERSQRSACCQPYHSIRSIIQRSIAVLAALSKIAGLSSTRAFALGLNCSNLQTSINKLRHWAFMDAENIGFQTVLRKKQLCSHVGFSSLAQRRLISEYLLLMSSVGSNQRPQMKAKTAVNVWRMNHRMLESSAI